jgi:kynureninase
MAGAAPALEELAGLENARRHHPSMNSLLSWRDQFPILDKTTYLISNSLGAMPRAVYDRLKDYADIWATRGVRAWEEGWWEAGAEAGDRIGGLLGAEPGSISIHQNVTLTQAVIASCFDFSGRRNKVVLVDLEFPSIVYFYLEQRRRGARVEMVKSEDGVRVPLDKLLDAIDEETLLVPVSHVIFRSSYLQDARAIVERAHQVGAHVVLDVYQSAGTVPLDLKALEVDFAVGGVLKWLCGGPGVAYLYVRPDLRASLEPTMAGWLAHKRPFEFEVGEIDRTEDSYRFLNGTPQILPVYACRPGLEIIGQAGIENIRARSIEQTGRLIRGAAARGWRVNTPRDPGERGGTVSIDCPHGYEIMRELVARDVLVDYRPKAGIRLSPHFYNRDDEIDFALEQIEDIVSTRAWERHLQHA